MANFETLKIEATYKLRLENDEIVTTAIFNPNGTNFAVGTSFGTIIFGSLKIDN